MSDAYTGLYPGSSPVTLFSPLSASTASTPGIPITATTATGGGTPIHTADPQATDVVYAYVTNNSSSSLTAYIQMGSTATNTSRPVTISTGSWVLAVPGWPIRSSGVVGIWTTASTGLIVDGYVARTLV
jgi:hypothetical protein